MLAIRFQVSVVLLLSFLVKDKQKVEGCRILEHCTRKKGGLTIKDR